MRDTEDPQISELAEQVMDRQQDGRPTSRLHLLERWRVSRYRRALAAAPVDALVVALTAERQKRDAAPSA